MLLIAGEVLGQETISAPSTRSEPATTSEALITIVAGDLPIIITSPHGGRETIPGVPPRENSAAERFVTQTDENTYELATALADELDRRLDGHVYRVFARFQRKYCDVNRPPEHAYESPLARREYDAYHAHIGKFTRAVQSKWQRGLLLDVHGQATFADELLIGTHGGTSVARLIERQGRDAFVGREGFVGLVERAGFKTLPKQDATDLNVPKYNGGYTVTTYGSSSSNSLDAIQLEFGRDYRETRAIAKETGKKISAAVATFSRTHKLLPAPQRK